MRTILGLSKTSTSIGWVLVDGCDVAGDLLDHDSFDITDASTAAPAERPLRLDDLLDAPARTPGGESQPGQPVIKNLLFFGESL